MDYDKFKIIRQNAEDIWYDTWREMGSKQEGSCCVGMCIKTEFGKIDCPPTQGNISASESSKEALKYLRNRKIKATYFDGYMN